MKSKLCLVALIAALALTACGGNGPTTPKAGAQPPTGWRIYGDARLRFSIDYPEGWHTDSKHVYPTPVNDQRLAGVAFIVPQGLTSGTNLSDDSYVSVESAPQAARCDVHAFLSTPDTERSEDQGALHRNVATAGDAGAGNFYDERVYALEGSKPCLAIRYFIHSTNIGAYTPGTVKQFDRAKLVGLFDQIRSTFARTTAGTRGP